MKTILLAGSSIFQQWADAVGLAPSSRVKNRAVGGTTSRYWSENLGEVVTSEALDAVLLYCGSNDFNHDIAEAEIIANVVRCAEIVHDRVPTAAFAYFSIIKAPQKQGKWDRIDRVNATIRGQLPVGDLYVESNTVFFSDGLPIASYFVDDGLHLTAKAYTALAAYAQPILANWLS